MDDGPTTRAHGEAVDAEQLLSQSKIRTYQIIIGLLCAGMLVVDGYNVAVLNFVAPLVAIDLGVTRAELGYVLTANIAGNVIGYFSLPLLAHRFGPKRVAIIAVLLFGAAESIAAFSTTMPMLLAFRFMAGIGLAGAFVCAVTLTGEYFPLRWRSSAVTYVLLGYSAGQMVSGGAAQFFHDTAYPWRGPLLLGGILGLSYAFVVMRFLPDSMEFIVNRSKKPERAVALLNRIVTPQVPEDSAITVGKKGAARTPVRALFEPGRRVTTILLWFAAIMSLFVSGIMHSWLTTLLVDAGMPYQDAVNATVFVTAAGIAAGLTVGPLMDRFGPFVVMVGLFLICAAAVTLLGFATPYLLIIPIAIAAFVQYYCSSGLSKGTYAMAVYLYPTALRPTGVGWVLGVSRIGAVSGPFVVGFLLQSGWTPNEVFHAMAVPLLLGAGALTLAKRNQARITKAAEESR